MFRVQRRRSAIRLTAAVALAGVLSGSLSIPLPTLRTSILGERYPCENCPCGCASAASCWRDCCCMTDAQKVSWARKNKVKVPDFVLAAARREAAAHRGDANAGHAGSASESLAQAAPRCAHCARPASPGPSCCSVEKTSNADCGAACSDQCRDAAPSAEVRLVLVVSALKCRGVRLTVGSLPPSVPPPTAATDFELNDAGQAYQLAAAPYLPPRFDVATPPPNWRRVVPSLARLA